LQKNKILGTNLHIRTSLIPEGFVIQDDAEDYLQLKRETHDEPAAVEGLFSGFNVVRFYVGRTR